MSEHHIRGGPGARTFTSDLSPNGTEMDRCDLLQCIPKAVCTNANVNT